MRKILVILGALGALAATHARADTGLVQICTNATLAGHPAQDCIVTLKWDHPAAADLVLSRPVGSTNEWASDTTWKAWSALAPTDQYRTCPLDLVPPAVHGNGIGDPCGNSQLWLSAIVVANGLPVFTWIPPTENEDGVVLKPGDLAGYTLSCDGVDTPIDNPGLLTYTPTAKYPPGPHVCTLKARGSNGLISMASAPLSFTVPQPAPPRQAPPKSPTGFSVR